MALVAVELICNDKINTVGEKIRSCVYRERVETVVGNGTENYDGTDNR